MNVAHAPDRAVPRAPLPAAAAGAGSENGDIDPSFVITHTAAAGAAPQMYEMIENKDDGCTKVVLKP